MALTDIIPDEKKLKVIKDYPMLSLVILLLSLCGYQQHRIDGKNDTIIKMQDERIKQVEKENQKKDELLDLWRDLGRQSSYMNKQSIKNDTLQ